MRENERKIIETIRRLNELENERHEITDDREFSRVCTKIDITQSKLDNLMVTEKIQLEEEGYEIIEMTTSLIHKITRDDVDDSAVQATVPEDHDDAPRIKLVMEVYNVKNHMNKIENQVIGLLFSKDYKVNSFDWNFEYKKGGADGKTRIAYLMIYAEKTIYEEV